jgi:hypothetical protein
MTDTDTKEAIDALRQEMLAELATLRRAIAILRHELATMGATGAALAAALPAEHRSKTRKRRRLIPNAETIAAMREPSVGPFHSVEELMADLNAPGD